MKKVIKNVFLKTQKTAEQHIKIAVFNNNYMLLNDVLK